MSERLSLTESKEDSEEMPKHNGLCNKLHKLNLAVFYLTLVSLVLGNFLVPDTLLKFEETEANLILTIDSQNSLLVLVRWIQLIITVSAAICLVFSYVNLHSMAYNIKIDLSPSLTGSPLIWMLLTELILLIPFNYPGMTQTMKIGHADSETEADMPLEIPFVFLMLLCRSYHPFRILLFHRGSTAIYDFDSLLSIRERISFSFRSAVHKWGVNVGSLVMLVYNNVFAFGLQRAEVVFVPFYPKPDWRNPVAGIFGTFQCLIPFSLGDYPPKTVMGRTAVFLCTLVGYFMISVFMFSLFRFLRYSSEDNKAIAFCNYVEKRKQLMKKAAKVVQNTVRLHFLKQPADLVSAAAEFEAEKVKLDRDSTQNRVEFSLKKAKQCVEKKLKVYSLRKNRLEALKTRIALIAKNEKVIQKNNERILELLGKLNTVSADF